MTAQEMIKKYHIQLHGSDQIAVPGGATLAKSALSEIKAAKPEILAELQHREAERVEIEARRHAEREAEKQAIVSGEKPIILHYYDGEVLQGYMVHDPAASLLTEIGLAKYVNGWGYHISQTVVDVLGESFTYPQAVEYTRPAREAAEAKVAAKEQERVAKFQQPCETGKPVELYRTMADCNDSREECSTDIVTVWAMPDGSTKEERTHTW